MPKAFTDMIQVMKFSLLFAVICTVTAYDFGNSDFSEYAFDFPIFPKIQINTTGFHKQEIVIL